MDKGPKNSHSELIGTRLPFDVAPLEAVIYFFASDCYHCDLEELVVLQAILPTNSAEERGCCDFPFCLHLEVLYHVCF